ncbi:L-asparaginase 1 [Cypionkella aquatica]|uniref:L-asparaginase 1 n=1 Tax=Cypionkella aquatica TaxID=1756042 RepID=A0AA37U1D1_9RHOB|nr:asparaginase [Cypionkella aquatica]GLS87882.1 L-asparaginase 1 [Cypionkella aquatica]
MKLLLIHTGGTIGMVATEAGFAPAEGVIEAALADLGARDVTLLPLLPLIDSAQATPADWNRIAQAIVDNHNDYNGFIVTHGTDTLAFTASALCFALAGLQRPVVLTGSMRPLTVAKSDGLQNLSDALHAAKTAPPGVWVQFAGQLLHGARVRKAHSSALDAFTASRSAKPPLQPGKIASFTAYKPAEIGILSMAPGQSEAYLSHALSSLDAVVLRVFGAGTLPETAALRAGLLAAQSRQTPVIAISQSPKGGVALGTYAAGDLMLQAGVIDGRDMTPEAAYTKLYHVLSLPEDQRQTTLARNIVGECS